MSYLESRRDIPNGTNFKFCEKPLVDGLTSGHLNNLYDIAIKWGKVGQDRKHVIFESGYIDLGFEISIEITINVNQQLFMMISKKSTLMTPISIPLQGGTQIAYDSNLSSRETEEAIQCIDEIAGSKGFVNQETGERIVLKEGNSSQYQDIFPHLSVKTLQREEGTIIKVRKNIDPRQVLNSFDEPSLLDIFDHAIFGKVIGLKADKDFINSYNIALKEVLKDMRIGIDDFERIKQISQSEKTMRVINLLVSKKMSKTNRN